MYDTPAARATTFELDPRLESDSFPIGELPLCLARLHADARFPWVVLIPARTGLRELHELTPPEREAFFDESCLLAKAMERLFRPEKLNIASLGNVVPQLHVHHVARFSGDPAWPGPVWGSGPIKPYAPEHLAERLAALRSALAPYPGFRG
ncbi:MAG: HIT domain-containing protein [Myxococcales bacterium]|nr:HIT domain-containing protein [Myxococcales bacterium]